MNARVYSDSDTEITALPIMNMEGAPTHSDLGRECLYNFAGNLQFFHANGGAPINQGVPTPRKFFGVVGVIIKMRFGSI